MAKKERKRLQERVQAGIDRVKSEGKQLGHHTKVDIPLAIQMKEQGRSNAYIGKRFNVSGQDIGKLLSKKTVPAESGEN